MAQKAFYFDSTRCTGCKTCQVACKETYSLPADNLYRRVYDYQGGTWDANAATGGYTANGVFGYHISIACNHCDNPGCMTGCPTGAIKKDADTGIVWIEAAACIGCKTCVTSCPYTVPSFFTEEGTVKKCDMCRDKVLAGAKPLCVTGCPMRALDWDDKDKLVAKYGAGDVQIAPLPKDTTGPNLVMKPHKDAKPSESTAGMTVSLEEELNLIS